ncbi:hypothetical protein E4U41_004760, partial [Claviceps citrina]
MDIFKVLSRGTKRTAAKHKAPVQQLPSAGTKTNPQLYHDQVRGMKRKRRAAGGDDEDDDADAPGPAKELPVVDFFAPKQEVPEGGKHSEGHVVVRAPSPELELVPAAAAAKKKLTEDECRQLLRSHRLKIALLSEHEEPQKPKKKKKKKRQNADLEDEEDDKDKDKDKNKKKKKNTARNLFPQPLESFADLRATYGISKTVAENLVRQSYRLPTEVQMGSLPLLLCPGRALADAQGSLAACGEVDLLAVAPTGSGKTVSFLVPAVDRIMKRRERERAAGVGGGGGGLVRELEALIVAPTRELVHQIVNEGNKLVQGTGIKIVGMKKETQLAAGRQLIVEDGSEEEEDEDEEEEEEYEDGDEDGDDKSEQEKDTKGRPRTRARKPHPETKTDILVTTPQLLLNLLQSGPSGTHKVLPTVRDLILDEADVLLDPLFKETTLALWTACTNEKLRVSFWSATMGSNIEALVTEELRRRAESRGRPQNPFVRLVVGLKDTAVPNIIHRLIYTASEQGKLLALRQLVHPTGGGGGGSGDSSSSSGPPLRPPLLVFTQTIDRATALHEELKYDIPLEAGGSSRIAALHSALSDPARSAVMRRFRAGEIWVLITTDVLARGVDFAGVNGVVNYDVPGSAAA